MQNGCKCTALSSCVKHPSVFLPLVWHPFLSYLSFGWGSSWLWSSPPPPVIPLTITLSELFLLLCGKMAERKCVYTVILLSVCAVWPRPEIFFGMLSSVFCISIHTPTPTHISLSFCLCLTLLLWPAPHISLTLWHSFFNSDRRGRPDRYSDNMVSGLLLNACKACSAI